MKHHIRSYIVVVTSLLLFCLAETGRAERSTCETCHLDEAMIIKNLSHTKARTSSMQSGAG